MTLHRYVPPFSLPPHGDGLAADSWHVIAGRGAATLQLPAHWPSLWLPMRGRLSMQAQDAHWTLFGGEGQLWRAGALNVQASHESRWLALVSMGEKNAVGTYGDFSFGGAWAWYWKDRIDRRFIAKYREAPKPKADRPG